jgi:hypothetical protein
MHSQIVALTLISLLTATAYITDARHVPTSVPTHRAVVVVSSDQIRWCEPLLYHIRRVANSSGHEPILIIVGRKSASVESVVTHQRLARHWLYISRRDAQNLLGEAKTPAFVYRNAKDIVTVIGDEDFLTLHLDLIPKVLIAARSLSADP